MFSCDSSGAVPCPAAVHVQSRSPFGRGPAISVPEPVDRSVWRVNRGIKYGRCPSKSLGRDNTDYREYGHSYTSKRSTGYQSTLNICTVQNTEDVRKVVTNIVAYASRRPH